MIETRYLEQNSLIEITALKSEIYQLYIIIGKEVRNVITVSSFRKRFPLILNPYTNFRVNKSFDLSTQMSFVEVQHTIYTSYFMFYIIYVGSKIIEQI